MSVVGVGLKNCTPDLQTTLDTNKHHSIFLDGFIERVHFKCIEVDIYFCKISARIKVWEEDFFSLLLVHILKSI